jgi:HSP20 family protein
MTLLRTYRPTMRRSTENPFSELLNQFFNDEKMESNQFFAMPPANLLETNENFKIEIAVPGFEKKDFSIELEEDLLTISLDKEEEGNKDQEYLKREFQFNQFRRVFRLSDKVDKEHIKGHYSNGILQVVVPKKEEVIKNANKSIEVE